MRTSNTFGVRFITRPNKMKDEKAPIYARVTVDRQRIEVSLKQFVHPENWSPEKGMARGKSEDVLKLNTYLEQIRAQFVECYRELQLNRKLITAEAVKKLYLGEEEKEHSLLGVFEYHNNEMKKELEPGTQKNYYTTKRYVENFLTNKYHTSDIYLSHLNYKFITDFEKYVKENPLDPDNPCTQNGTMKHIERLRKVVNLAIKNDWLIKDPFMKYSPKFVKNERGFLTADELDTIETKELKLRELMLVRDLFVFSCYTGLAYIDAMKLTPDNVRRGIDGDYWLFSARTKNRNKTEEQVKIPLLPKALEVMQKYQAVPEVIASGGVLPHMSNQVLNRNLKKLATACDIHKILTFHMARHTFATTVTLTNGVPIETVSKVLGHSSIRTTQIYAKVVEKKVSEDMNLLKMKLSRHTTINTQKSGTE